MFVFCNFFLIVLCIVHACLSSSDVTALDEVSCNCKDYKATTDQNSRKMFKSYPSSPAIKAKRFLFISRFTMVYVLYNYSSEHYRDR